MNNKNKTMEELELELEPEPKPNIVMYPPPSLSHLNPMVTFAHFLLHHHPYLSVTILLPSTTTTSATDTTTPSSSITFLPLPPLSVPSTFSILTDPSHFFRYAELQNPDLHETLTSLPNVKALIIDFFCTYATKIAVSLGIPTYYFYTSSGCSLATLLHMNSIDELTHPNSLKDLDAYFDIPGLPLFYSKDMPMSTADRTLPVYRHLIQLSKRMPESAGILVNTFDSFEIQALGAIRGGKSVKSGPTPPIYCVGPQLATADHGVDRDRHECLGWLDAQPSRSVVFLSFGSAGFSFSPEQLKEIALGLEMSKARFLWVLRAPHPGKDSCRNSAVEAYLPEGFVEKTRERGLLVENWAPQVEILNHYSIGGFVTHCGWNSVLEAVVAGVPMLAWPLYAEQPINKLYLVEETKVALGLSMLEGGFVRASELADRVDELMNQESGNGKAVKERVMAMRESALAAVSEGGSSVKGLAELADPIKRSQVWI